jgi:hypothetical protein
MNEKQVLICASRTSENSNRLFVYRGITVFLHRHCVETGSGTAKLSIQWVPEALYMRVNQPEREANHSAFM